MTSDVFGSRPELGSSQKRYFGLSDIALAIATRFCMPPDISPGNFSSAPLRFTRSRHSMARLCRSRSVIVENMSSGNITFSITVSESKRAALWKIIPISRRIITFSRFVIFTKSRPSYSTCPLVGSRSPTRFFMSTVLPLPLRPIIRFVLPSSKTVLIFFSTSLPSNDLYRFLTSIMTIAVLGIHH